MKIWVFHKINLLEEAQVQDLFINPLEMAFMELHNKQTHLMLV